MFWNILRCCFHLTQCDASKLIEKLTSNVFVYILWKLFNVNSRRNNIFFSEYIIYFCTHYQHQQRHHHQHHYHYHHQYHIVHKFQVSIKGDVVNFQEYSEFITTGRMSTTERYKSFMKFSLFPFVICMNVDTYIHIYILCRYICIEGYSYKGWSALIKFTNHHSNQ